MEFSTKVAKKWGFKTQALSAMSAVFCQLCSCPPPPPPPRSFSYGVGSGGGRWGKSALSNSTTLPPSHTHKYTPPHTHTHTHKHTLESTHAHTHARRNAVISWGEHTDRSLNKTDDMCLIHLSDTIIKWYLKTGSINVKYVDTFIIKSSHPSMNT